MTKHLRVFEVRNFFDFEISQDESIQSRFVSFQGSEFYITLILDHSCPSNYFISLFEDEQRMPSQLTVSELLNYLSFYSDHCTLRDESGLSVRLVKCVSPTFPLSYDFEIVKSEEF
ncbi:hypothetical protein GNP63_12565 [Aliivibrio fischeri]|uniref:hypothetical protein n=1 Tax=Aliivibrio fischeri TaxID=668 RepID=UPI0012D9B372|nr:hypothetical protein [Aliivibrio fischeri]MUH97370.1 hypothetical protein [Aliivibrio fischeri]MUI64983.1 hypothetical protein [Aliivibrio fischeri]